MLNGITTQCGDLTLVDSSKFGEYPIVFAQYDADNVVEVVPINSYLVEVVTTYTEHYAGGILHLLGESHVAVLLQKIHGSSNLAAVEVFASAKFMDVEDV